MCQKTSAKLVVGGGTRLSLSRSTLLLPGLDFSASFRSSGPREGETEHLSPFLKHSSKGPVPSYSPLTYGSISPSSSDVASSDLPTVSNPVVRSEKRLPIPATTDSRGCLPTQGLFPPPWRALRKEGREGSLFIRGMSVCFSSSPRQTSGRLKFIRAHSFPTRHQKSAVPVFTGL